MSRHFYLDVWRPSAAHYDRTLQALGLVFALLPRHSHTALGSGNLMSESNAVREGLVRQRRGLIVASLALLFYESAGLVIRQINLLGNTVDVTNPGGASFFLWVTWSYFYLRYYQFFRDLPDKGFATRYSTQLDKFATQLAVKRFIAKYEPRPDAPGMVRDLTARPKDVRIIHSSGDYWEAELDFEVRYHTADARATQHLGGWKIVLYRPDLRFIKIKAVLHVLLNSRLATEYVLPFLVGVVPPFYVIYSKLAA